jgi:outer membrane protein assembly factor BamB
MPFRQVGSVQDPSGKSEKEGTMAIANRTIGVVVGCALLGSAVGAFAQDWPQWRGPNRDGKAAGFDAPQTWPKTLEPKWRKTVGTGDATPALVGDRLYVFTRQGGDEVIGCLEAESGNQLWQEKYAAEAVTGAPASHPGPRSSPAVAEGKVVTLGVGGILSCLDAGTGKLAWRSEVLAGRVPQFFTAMSPIVVDGMCIAHLGGEGEGAAIAFDLATGNQKWKWTGDSPGYASPVLMTVDGTQQLVIQGEKSLVGIAVSDGTQLWRVPTPPQRRYFFNSATPIVDGSTVIFTGQGAGTRAVAIEKRDGGFAAKELWSNEKLGTGFNTPVLKDGLLFGLSDRGNFFCLDARTGKTAWTDNGKRDRFGAIVDAGAVLLALPATSQLIAFNPDGKKFKQLAAIKVADSPTYAHPIVAGKRIFVKDRDALTMFAVE